MMPTRSDVATIEKAREEGAFVWQSQIGPQTAFHMSSADEILYGGAAGGGKSESLLVEAVRYKDVPGYHAVLFRRTFKELERPDGLIMRSQQLFTDIGDYRAGLYRWIFQTGKPSDPATLDFSHMEKLRDMYAHQSAQYAYIGFDELTSFLEEQYLYLLSRGRSTRGVPVRYRSATNPGNDGHAWVFKRWGPWLDPTHPRAAKPGEMRWFARIQGEDKEVEADWRGPEDEEPLSRTFIPAFLEDNPALVAHDPGYKARLESLPEPYRSQLRDGNWLIGKEDEWQVIPYTWVRAAMDRWTPDGGREFEVSAVACDPARGVDKACLGHRRGNWVDELKYRNERDTMYLVGEIRLIYAEELADGHTIPARIDVIGVGAGVYDRMRELNEELYQDPERRDQIVEAYPINSGEKSYATDQSGLLTLINVRAEMWWHMRDLLDPDNPLKLEEPVALPPDKLLLADLTAPRWRMTSSGILIESKEDLKKRIGRSTDAGDTVAMLFYETGGVGAGRGGIWV
jgi:hypothetical protein